jgi:hypothetical protein
MKPTLRDVLLVIAFQIGAGMLFAGIQAVLPIDKNPGLSCVAAMCGSMAFVQLKEKRDPGRFVGSYAHQLALRATLLQVAAGLPIAIVLALTLDPDFAAPFRAVPFLLVVSAIALPVGYLTTRLGFRMGLSAATRGRAAAAARAARTK